MKIPFFRPLVPAGALTALRDVLASGRLSTGPQVEALESRLSHWTNVRNVLAVNSCTAALHLALELLHVGPGDAVFIPTLAFAADFQVVDQTGATAVLVDSESDTLCMDPNALEREVTRLHFDQPSLRPRAVIVVDYAGQMADYASLQEVCLKWGMRLIEDAAHAIPAGWRATGNSRWQGPGNIADFACLSFYATKPITTGEGGALLISDDDLVRRARAMCLHGLEAKTDVRRLAGWKREVTDVGYKYNLSDLAATLGLCWMDELESHWEFRKHLVSLYTTELSRFVEFCLPSELPNRKHAWHLYVIRLPNICNESDRDKLIELLHERGVEVSVHWVPLHMHRRVKARALGGPRFPVAEEAYRTMISLPLFPGMKDVEVQYVCQQVLSSLPWKLSFRCENDSMSHFAHDSERLRIT
ncbi:MAG TPA: DegT/DnrJ/EryC1/StrS family aminotransferase [Polyangiaceae bacterium]